MSTNVRETTTTASLEAVEFQGKPKEEDLKQAFQRGQELAEQILAQE